ncbi:hypothetical protein ABK040_001835 [Willaertia magna]
MYMNLGNPAWGYSSLITYVTVLDKPTTNNMKKSNLTTTENNNQLSSTTNNNNQQIIVNSYHKIKESYSNSLLKYNQEKYFNALQGFLECFRLLQQELRINNEEAFSSSNTINKKKKKKNQSTNKKSNTTTTSVNNITTIHNNSNEYYNYLYFQVNFHLAKCHFKLGELSKSLYYLNNKCSESDDITSLEEYQVLKQEVERMMFFDKIIDENKISPKEDEDFVYSIQNTHFSTPMSHSPTNSYSNELIPYSSSSPHNCVNSRVHSSKIATIPESNIYSLEGRNNWQNTFLRYQKSVCK